MGKLFDAQARLFEGLVYDKDVYDKRPGCDPELICHGLEPVTDIEARGMDMVSEVDAELMIHKLSSIVEEARDVYMALSISEGIITGDMNCGIFTASGDPVSVATGIYFHTLLNNGQIKYINKYYRPHPTVGLQDGDIYFFNDELGGGVHVFDMFTAMPIFWKGELVAWAEVGGHQGETGSTTPGGFAPKAKSRYEEGLHIPAMRIGSDFMLNQDVLDMMGGSVRNPFVFIADLKSRVATMMQIRQRLLREVERRGPEIVVGCMRRILVKGERDARARLKEVNDGIFRAVIFNDEHGNYLGLTRIPLTVFKEGDGLTVLVQGVSPQTGIGPFHGSWHLARAVTAVYLFSYFYRGLMPNAGLLEPVRYLIEGPSMVNSTDEVAHGNSPSACAFITQNLYTIGAKMLFASPYREGVQAAHSRNYVVPAVGGENRRGYYTANMTGTVNAGGGGGRFDMDAEDAVGFYWGPFCDAGEVEDQDDRMPHVILSRKLDTNFHGFGKYRGGTPLVEIGGPCGDRGCTMATWGQGNVLSHNMGLFGGYAGPPNPRFVLRNSDVFDRIRAGKDIELGQHKMLTEKTLKGDYIMTSSAVGSEAFKEGDLFVHSVGGGGGYGDVLERDPESVLEDVKANLITRAVAEKVYCVRIDPETDLLDPAGTERLRQAARKERLKKGKPFDAFVASWSKKKPPARLLTYYGHWPEPRLVRYDKPFWGFYDQEAPKARRGRDASASLSEPAEVG
ncbi:MAG: hydantoinase B/oxoprolinase family protein [Rhodospirillales bacterium]